jgi:hypothetical protein
MNFLIDGPCLFSSSQLCLLFRYLVWSCEDSATFRSLAQVNRFCGELCREHRGMKKVEFSREFKIPENWPFQKLKGRVLPNGYFHGDVKWKSTFRFPVVCVVDGVFFDYHFMSDPDPYTPCKIYTTGRLFIFEYHDNVYWVNLKTGRYVRALRCNICNTFHKFYSSKASLSRSCWQKHDLQFNPVGFLNLTNFIVNKSRITAIIELAKGRGRPFKPLEGHNM